jgi:hypothetical protein
MRKPARPRHPRADKRQERLLRSDRIGQAILKRHHRLGRRLPFDLARAGKRQELEYIVWCGVSGVGFVHTTTVNQLSRTKRSSLNAGFWFIKHKVNRILSQFVSGKMKENERSPLLIFLLYVSGGGYSARLRLNKKTGPIQPTNEIRNSYQGNPFC